MRPGCFLVGKRSSRVQGGLGCAFFFQAGDGIRGDLVTGVQTCALPICAGADVAQVLVLEGVEVHAADERGRGRRSEERRVGKECRARWWRCRYKKKEKKKRSCAWKNDLGGKMQCEHVHELTVPITRRS